MRTLIYLLFLALLFGACSQKNTTANKPAIYWYQKIVKNISNFSLDIADDAYFSLRLEHPSSPMLKEATLILAHRHAQLNNYELANFYYDDYIKRYGEIKERHFVQFLQLMANYKALKFSDRNQKRFIDFKATTQNTLEQSTVNYKPFIQTIYFNTILSIAKENYNTALFYQQRSKTKAFEFYQKQSTLGQAIASNEVKKPNKSWFRTLFE